jgi:hypothetical protein
MNTGFGSPTAHVPGGTPHDIGFGSASPDAADQADWGFGDKGGSAVQALVVLPITDKGERPDDGGIVLRVKADWKNLGPGPYQVLLRDAATTTLYPQDRFGCWSIIPGQEWKCAPNKAGTELAFAMPPVPPGIYDVVVNYGPGLGTQVASLKALAVVWRGRQSQVYSIRRQLLPSWKGAGSRSPSADILLGG